MEYERIEKVQAGIISPSKLRMKLLGPHHHRKKDGSNSNSSRTSPSRIEDAEFVNSLLDSKNDNLDDEVTSPSLDALSLKPSSNALLDRKQNGQISYGPKETMPKENGDMGRAKTHHFPKVDTGSSSAIHAVRAIEDENLDYDSNASSSSFEFDKGERPGNNPATRSLFRPIPSKWNDAEKWIMNRQNIQANHSKKKTAHNQANRMPTNMGRVAPESGQAHGRNPVVESLPQSKDLKEVNELGLSCSRSTDDQSVTPGIRSVAMRDMGTEMTPVPSQEPSRTATPVGSATPLRSPVSSMPSTPRRGAPAPTPLDNTTDEDSQFPVENGKRNLSEEEMKIKTRREIAALGVQLGKMNIAAWASKDEQEKNKSSPQEANVNEQERIEFEKRAALWEEAEKSKHTARFKREEIKIQAWESQQKAKLEAEMRRIEAKVEQMRAQTHAKMVKKIAMARQRSEEKRAAAEARKNREAERTAAQTEYIRQTGRLPSSNYICCGWL
ncbi:microtubule-associated protein futsch-like isoform X2 [Glycine soja]|uniref:Remorin 4.1 isoform C n=1 Tax=Glycine soja TaxID=3848 RepID=A0A445KND1_GLYSO|nr:microtubule-associated protein futsch-like isoform X2 [Glycine soja]RZC12427.1 Remorin 4.1 isoform C [Glycine soja]